MNGNHTVASLPGLSIRGTHGKGSNQTNRPPSAFGQKHYARKNVQDGSISIIWSARSIGDTQCSSVRVYPES